MATAQYDKDNTTRINLKLNNITDAEIISKLKSVPSMQGYIRFLIQNDIEDSKPMHRISIDNGAHFCSPEEAIESISWDLIVHYMDSDIADHVDYMLAPCSNIDFLRRYLKVSEDDLIIG